ncbi:MAG: Rieske (2Fe-2S) protein, partial [Rhodospirillaceae bacterium]|nr:Rieske (2Fe-2S) protein [Rhodospirillaceae bacterium]
MAALDAKTADLFPVDNFTDDPTTTFTLPSPWYFKPEVFEKEKEEIFFKSWRVVCHASELANPGDYATVDIHGQGVFALRGRDGNLRAFYNVCQHRAHELLQGSGNVKAVITCPYHAWAYGSDGALRTARNCENVKGFDKADFGLKSVRIEELCGLIFFNLDDDAVPLAQQAPGLEADIRAQIPYWDELELTDIYDFGGRPIEAGWKVV